MTEKVGAGFNHVCTIPFASRGIFLICSRLCFHAICLIKSLVAYILVKIRKAKLEVAGSSQGPQFRFKDKGSRRAFRLRLLLIISNIFIQGSFVGILGHVGPSDMMQH